MTLQLRLAKPSDHDSIAVLDEFGGNRKIEIEQGTCWVAEVDGSVVGYASFEPRGLLGQPLLTYLCVRTDSRRRGTATALVKAIQAVAKGRKLISSTEDWCLGTQCIFERLGWSRIGQIDEVNKDGSSELFYAVNIGV